MLPRMQANDNLLNSISTAAHSRFDHIYGIIVVVPTVELTVITQRFHCTLKINFPAATCEEDRGYD